MSNDPIEETAKGEEIEDLELEDEAEQVKGGYEPRHGGGVGGGQ